MQDVAMSFARDGIQWLLMLAMPILLTALIVGFLMGIVQAATQIQEGALSFVPKLLALGLLFFLMGPWMMDSMVEMVRHYFTNLNELIQAG